MKYYDYQFTVLYYLYIEYLSIREMKEMRDLAWIETSLKERDFQNDFLELVKKYGWKLASHFKKVAFDDKWVNPLSPNLPITTIEFHMAEHFIYENAAGQKFGIAFYGMQAMKYGTLKEEVKPENIWLPVESGGTGQDFIAEKLKKIPLGDWITNKFPPAKLTSSIYFYQIDTTDDSLAINEDIIIMWKGTDLKRACLDAEVKQTKGYFAQGSWSLQVQEANPSAMQSPISQANIRIPTIEQRLVEFGEDGIVQKLNIWQDSLVRITGQITSDRLLVYLQADPSSAFEENGVPSIPLFMGNIMTTKFAEDVATKADLPALPDADTTYRVAADESREGKVSEYVSRGGVWELQLDNTALIAGSAVDKPEPLYDFDSIKPLRVPLMPLLKDYTTTPSNAIDSVMMRKNKFGSRYQSHFLSWNTGSNLMPPDRISDDGRKYPRAWLSNKEKNDEYNYRFNVSRYTGKVHTSRIYIIHPEEGVRGWIPFAIGFNPLSLVTGDKLKVKTSSCPDVYDIYKYALIEGVSPLTKRPATAYRPVGLGIYSEEETRA